jgi:hypothetical protein
MTLPLYHKILSETIEEKRKTKNEKHRTFSLLPYKSGFTLSHIPISKMAFFYMVNECHFDSCKADVASKNHQGIWERFANLKKVETVSRKFGYRIVTDGFAVSILMNKPTCLTCSMPADAFSTRAHEYVTTDEGGIVSVEFKLPVYPRTYEFLTKHPGARGTCSKKDNEFSIGVS